MAGISGRKQLLKDTKTVRKVEEFSEKYWSLEEVFNRLKKETSPIQISTSNIHRGFAKGFLVAELQRNSASKGVSVTVGIERVVKQIIIITLRRKL